MCTISVDRQVLLANGPKFTQCVSVSACIGLVLASQWLVWLDCCHSLVVDIDDIQVMIAGIHIAPNWVAQLCKVGLGVSTAREREN